MSRSKLHSSALNLFYIYDATRVNTLKVVLPEQCKKFQMQTQHEKEETTWRDSVQEIAIPLTWGLEVEHKLYCQQENNWQGQKY